MREGCIFGGEGGGGVIEPRVVPVRNSLVGMAYVLQYLAETGKPLSQLVDEIPALRHDQEQVALPAGGGGRGVGPVPRQHFAARSRRRSSTRPTGCGSTWPKAWVCVRASNTEPIMRIIAEAKTEDTAAALVRQIGDIAHAVIGR